MDVDHVHHSFLFTERGQSLNHFITSRGSIFPDIAVQRTSLLKEKENFFADRRSEGENKMKLFFFWDILKLLSVQRKNTIWLLFRLNFHFIYFNVMWSMQSKKKRGEKGKKNAFVVVKINPNNVEWKEWSWRQEICFLLSLPRPSHSLPNKTWIF